MKFFLRIFIISLILLSCNTDKSTAIDVSNIVVDFKIKRFDNAFYQASKETLYNVKEAFPLLFPKQVADTVWLAKINDKEEQELYNETQKLYNDFSNQENKIRALFKHIKYYNPKFKSPNIITVLSNIDYENKVIYADSLLLISLDVYLGKTHKFYSEYPKYIKENNTKEHLIVDVANAIINKQMLSLNNRSFLSKMIFEGKKLYLLEMYLPAISAKEKSGYSIDKLHWAEESEEQIWMYFMENELLYSTNTKLNSRFLENAPFSKFYTEEDNNSPGKIGGWLGLQIVKSYMQHNNVSLQKLIQIDAQNLLDASNYKPKK